jgi:O-antigen ligase
MAKKTDETSKKRGLSAFKLSLIVIILLLIPTTMEQLSMHQDTVKLVGRACVGIAGLFFVYGLFSKVMRFAGLILLGLIVVRALANEGVVELPKLLPKIEAKLEERK